MGISDTDYCDNCLEEDDNGEDDECLYCDLCNSMIH